MEDWATWISNNPFLQAIAILVAIGTLIYFLVSTVPTALAAVANVARYGIRRAISISRRPAILRAQESYDDARLVALWSFYLAVRAFLRIFFLPMLYLMLISATQILQNYENDVLEIPSVTEVIIVVFIAITVAPLLTIFTFQPILLLLDYLMFTRRKILRQIGRRNRVDPPPREIP